MADRPKNMLMPTTRIIERMSPLHTLRETTVTIDISECYPIVEYVDGSKVERLGLGRPALDKIASAAGIRWEASTGVVGKPTEDYLMYRAIATMVLPDGSTTQGLGTTEWFASEEVDPIREQVAELQKEAAKNPNDKRTFGKLAGKKKQLHDARAYRLGMTETKAKNRAIRSLLGIKAKYTAEEIAQPFVVPHVDFNPDLSDPNVKELIKAGAFAGAGALYGGGRPAIAQTETQALPAAPEPVVEDSPEWKPVEVDEDVVDYETGEVIEGEVMPEDEDGADMPDELEDRAAAGRYVLPGTGKFSGRTLADVEADKPGYCRWMLDNNKGSEATRAAMSAFLGE